MFNSCAVAQPQVAIRNIIAIGDFGCLLDLKRIYASLPHAYVKVKKKKVQSKKKKKKLLSASDREQRAIEKRQRERLPMEVSYNEQVFNGLTLRILKPVKTSMLLFRTGKVVCLGTKSLTELQQAGTYLAHILYMHSYLPVFNGFRVCNMVGSWSIDNRRRINLDKLYVEQGGMYEPEVFPAMQFYVGNVTLLIFKTGKIVATGAKQHEELNVAREKLSNILSSDIYFK